MVELFQSYWIMCGYRVSYYEALVVQYSERKGSSNQGKY